jgi:serine protease Do
MSVRRPSSFLAASLVGLTTTLVAAVAVSAPPKKPAPKPASSASAAPAMDAQQLLDAAAHGGKVTVAVLSGKLAVAAAPNASGSAAAPAEKVESPIDRARKGVVTLERGGEVIGLGSVLKDDGRIITALSTLGDGNGIDIRYPDGSTVHSKVGHSDRIWDLALLVPQVGKWPDGLGAGPDSDVLKAGTQLHAFAPGRVKAQPATVVLKSKRSLLGADDHLIRDVFEVATKIGPKEFGSPVVDEAGNVVAVLGRACVPVEKGPCLPTAFGVPTDAVKAFLRTAPASAIPPAAWLGIQGVVDKAGPVSGVRVVTVSPDGPADEAGLRGGKDPKASDMIVAVDDVPIASPEALSKAIGEKSVGDRVKLLVFGDGKFRDVTAVLRPAPVRRLVRAPSFEDGAVKRSVIISTDHDGIFARPPNPRRCAALFADRGLRRHGQRIEHQRRLGRRCGRRRWRLGRQRGCGRCSGRKRRAVDGRWCRLGRRRRRWVDRGIGRRRRLCGLERDGRQRHGGRRRLRPVQHLGPCRRVLDDAARGHRVHVRRLRRLRVFGAGRDDDVWSEQVPGDVSCRAVGVLRGRVWVADRGGNLLLRSHRPDARCVQGDVRRRRRRLALSHHRPSRLP